MKKKLQKRQMYVSRLRQTMNEHYPDSNTALREHPIKTNLKGTVVIHSDYLLTRDSIKPSFFKLQIDPITVIQHSPKMAKIKKKKQTMPTSVEHKFFRTRSRNNKM